MKTREIQTRRARHRIFFQHLVLAISLAFVTGQASATHNSHHNPNGPRASLLSTTTCALAGVRVDITCDPNVGPAALAVTTTVTNTSSDSSTDVQIQGWTISGTYKNDGNQKGGGGNMSLPLDGDRDVCALLGGCPVDIVSTQTMTACFALCAGAAVRNEVLSARELNGESTVVYGISGGEGKPLTNHCTADPVTGEGGGIKIDTATLAEIQEACSRGSGG